MTPFNRRHNCSPGNQPSSISLSGEMLKVFPNTVHGLLAAILDLHPHLVGPDISETNDRILRYAAKHIARESSDRLVTSDNQTDKDVLHHYLKP